MIGVYRLDWFGSQDVVELCGITYRQLDYWIRQKYVTPEIQQASGSGTARIFSRKDMNTLAVVGQLIKFGVSPKFVKTFFERAEEVEPSKFTLIGDEIHGAESSQTFAEINSITLVIPPLTGKAAA